MLNKSLKRFVQYFIIIALAFTLISWGDVGHSIISVRSQLSFNEEMDIFNSWLPYLAEHSSDPDKRKKDDPEEGPKHYIDIDNYPSFNSQGSIPQNMDSCIAIYGSSFVGKNGSLPWATLTSYDSLVSCLRRGDELSGKKHAADLCHYIADGHMPLHLTKNYDGQFTGNKGIHFRYEVEMINEYHSEIQYNGHEIKAIDNVRDYIFDYIYKNYNSIQAILEADDESTELDPTMTTEEYYDKLWSMTKGVTISLFESASHAIAELLYTAYLESGEPLAIQADRQKEGEFRHAVAAAQLAESARGR